MEELPCGEQRPALPAVRGPGGDIRRAGSSSLADRHEIGTYQGTAPSFGEGVDRKYKLDAGLYDYIPAHFRMSVENVTGRPLYTWWGEMSDDGTACQYFAVGPGGLGYVAGRIHNNSWTNDSPWLVAVDPSRARWLEIGPADADTSESSVASDPRSSSRQYRPFMTLGSNFLSAFGLLPAKMQQFLQEPFANVTPDTGWYTWYRKFLTNDDGSYTCRYQQWICVNKANSIVAVAYGEREVVSPIQVRWDSLYERLQQAPWSVIGTWYASSRPAPTAEDMDAYSLLGVDATASDEEITAAYRRLARYLHPNSPDYTAVPSLYRIRLKNFEELTDVFERIKTSAARAAYNSSMHLIHASNSLGRVGWWRSGPAADLAVPDHSPTTRGTR